MHLLPPVIWLNAQTFISFSEQLVVSNTNMGKKLEVNKLRHGKIRKNHKIYTNVQTNQLQQNNREKPEQKKRYHQVEHSN